MDKHQIDNIIKELTQVSWPENKPLANERLLLQLLAVSEKDFAENRVASLSSSYPDPRSTFMISVDANLKCSLHDLHPITTLWTYQITTVNLLGGGSVGSDTIQILAKNLTMDDCGIEFDTLFSSNDDAETSETSSGSGTGRNPYKFDFSLANLFRYKASGVKPTERITKSGNGSNHTTITIKSPERANPSMNKPASKNRSVSPGFMPEGIRKPNTGTTNVVTDKPEGSQEARPFKIDPADLYRSKSPGVKRFIGARV